MEVQPLYPLALKPQVKLRVVTWFVCETVITVVPNT